MSEYHDDDSHDDADVQQLADDPGMVRVKRGQEINVTRLDPTIRELLIGAGWDVRKYDGDPIDVDISVFLLDRHDKTAADGDFIFYNNGSSENGSVKHLGDSRTGAGDGDDENIVVDLLQLPFDVAKVAFILSIYDMDVNMTAGTFEHVKNVYFRLVNNETDTELFRFNLDEDIGKSTGLYIGYMERVGADWIFRAVGDTIPGGLAAIATDFGIIVAQSIRS